MKATISGILLLCSAAVFQSTSYPESDAAMYKAYVNSQDAGTMKAQWKTIVSQRDAAVTQAPGDRNVAYAGALARFGLLSATMRDKDEALFDEYADDTEEMLESLIDRNKKWGEPKALLSAVLGLKMGYSPIKGMFLGSKSQSMMEMALKEAPESPLVWKLYGNSKLFTPETWGGDISEAIKAYEKSLRLYEADQSRVTDNWFYIDTLAFLGQAYQKNGKTTQAIAVYEKALKAAPAFGWVKFTLLPAVKKSSTTNQ